MLSTIVSIVWSPWILIAAILLVYIYKWSTKNFDHFARQNVPYIPPIPVFGNSMPVLLWESPFDFFKRIYLQNKHQKYVGCFELRNPCLLIVDPEIIRQITVKDFDYFVNRRKIFDDDVMPLFSNSLFGLQDKKWKGMRSTLSPAFTGSKMRLMFQLIDDCGKSAIRSLRDEMHPDEPLEVNLKDLFTRYANDVIATCAFGLEIHSLSNKDNEFYQMSRKATNFSTGALIKFFLLATYPWITKLIKLEIFDKKFSHYFHSIVIDTMKQRSAKGIIRNDMINLLMEARKGVLQADDLGTKDSSEGFAVVEESTIGQKTVNRQLSDDDIVAQCFVFFFGGFETSSVLMCFCAHELAENPEIQRILIEEIDQVRTNLGDKPLSYEVLQKMKYLDMVMSETLRKWPPLGVIDRVCNSSYVIQDHVKLNPGDTVLISIVGIHYDPKYFSDPNKFDPERFSDENKGRIKPFTYFPFGIGPRNCIGSRFALMQAKAAIFHLLSEFTFEIGPKTNIPMKITAKGFSMQPKGGFWLNFRSRN